ncbi:MAG: hypothetical protein GY695_17510, partial [Aestuariibacter sp.]|nr:hypothetical protein [Aestuariibacter sp.]
NYQVTDIVYNYQDTAETMAQEYDTYYASCPDTSVDMVFSTCEPGEPSANNAVDYANNVASNNGYNVKVLKGSAESISAIQNWLSCPNLILLARVGHGSPSGIMVDDGTLSYSYFNGLSSTALNGKVIYFHSCQVHNSPLEPAIRGAGVQKFIGGDTDLIIGSSENVWECWMQKVIANGENMTPSLQSCSAQEPNAGDFGISGNGPDQLGDGGGGTPPPPSGDDTLTNGQTVSNLSAASGEWVHYKIDVPQGASNLTIQISGG